MINQEDPLQIEHIGLVWFICLTAYQLIVDNFVQNFDWFLNAALQSQLYFQRSAAIFHIVRFYLYIIICLLYRFKTQLLL